MRARRKRHLDERLEKVDDIIIAKQTYGFYSIPEQERFKIVDYNKIFGNQNPITLEIGCGRGKFVNDYATKFANVNVIAVEKISNVIIDACTKTKELNLQNVKYLNCGAENLLYFLPPNSVSEIILNFSTPYPRKSDTNRRLTYYRYLNLYKQLLTENGKITLKTDNADFFEYSKESLKENGFILKHVCYNLHQNGNPEDNIITEYEQKFINMGLPIMKLCATINKENLNEQN